MCLGATQPPQKKHLAQMYLLGLLPTQDSSDHQTRIIAFPINLHLSLLLGVTSSNRVAPPHDASHPKVLAPLPYRFEANIYTLWGGHKPPPLHPTNPCNFHLPQHRPPPHQRSSATSHPKPALLGGCGRSCGVFWHVQHENNTMQ